MPDPQQFSAKEFVAFLAADTVIDNDQTFGPVPVDNSYRVELCDNKMSVFEEDDPDVQLSPPMLAKGPPNWTGGNLFLWKFRAVPQGITPSSVPWSSPGGPEHTFTGLIPGITYSFQVTDADEDLEPLGAF